MSRQQNVPFSLLTKSQIKFKKDGTETVQLPLGQIKMTGNMYYLCRASPDTGARLAKARMLTGAAIN